MMDGKKRQGKKKQHCRVNNQTRVWRPERVIQSITPLPSRGGDTRRDRFLAHELSETN